MRHPIPRAALDDRLGFLGTSGSGKTYNAGTAVEILLANKARVVIVDPLGVWWGLRLRADGKTPSNFDVAIFGGSHGDLPLTEHAGALIGETAVSMAESCIIDLSELRGKAAERRFMTAFLDTIYQKAAERKQLFHLIVDEADLFAPQKPLDGAQVLLGHMNDVVRRGRVKGFIPWLISQRPAVLNKDVLSMVDGLLAFKMTSPQDRDALDAWIEGQADKKTGAEIKASLPTLQLGQGIVWLPGHGILTTAQFPTKVTFDSSRAPKRGEKVLNRKLKPLNLDALKDQLATVEAEAKANNPQALRSEIAALRAEKAKLEKQVATAKPVADKDALRAAEQKGFDQAKKKFGPACQRVLDKAITGAFKLAAQRAGELAKVLADDFKALRKDLPGVDAELTFEPSAPPAATAVPRFVPTVVPQTPSRAKPIAPVDGEDRPLQAERKPLAALASVYPAGMTEAQWAVTAGLKRSGGTWSTYVSRLRMAGRIIEQGDLFYVSEKGLADLGETVAPMPPPGLALVEFWAGKINGIGPMLKHLASIYPKGTTREDLASALNLAASGGTFSTYLSRLRSAGLIEESRDGIVGAAATLMERAA